MSDISQSAEPKSNEAHRPEAAVTTGEWPPFMPKPWASPIAAPVTSASENPPEVAHTETVEEPALRAEQAEALLAISVLLNSDLNAGRVLRDLLRQLCSLFRADRAAVLLRRSLPSDLDGKESEKELGQVVCAASLGLTEEYVQHITAYYENVEFRKLQALRQPLYIADAQNDQRLNGLREMNQREGLQVLMTLPLRQRNLFLGVIVLYHNSPRTYTAEETRLLSIFANQATLSIINARLYEETRRREREAALLAEVGRSFNASLKLREVLNTVVQTTAGVLGNTALVYVIKENTDEAYPVAFFTKNPEGVEVVSPVKLAQVVKIGEGAIGKTLQGGVPFLVSKPREVAKAAPFIASEFLVKSILSLPLRASGRVAGALVCYQAEYPGGKSGPTLDSRNIAFGQALADRAAVAIENARQYEAERREQRSKDEFLTLVSHELKTPLTNLKGYHHLVSKRLEQLPSLQTDRKPLLDSLNQYIGVMGTQIGRLQLLVNDLTSIDSIANGQLELQPRPTDIARLTQQKITETEQQLATTHTPRVEHVFDFRATPPIIIAEIDPTAYERVLHNLLSNAVKFSPKGGVIRVRLQQVSEEIRVSVQDSGIGIPEAEQERVFERFYKASSAPGRANGLGLGLYISRGLVQAMGGRISVSSEEGVGSIFTVHLQRYAKSS